MFFPEKGMPKGDVMKVLEGYRENDVKWRGGRVFAYTFHAGDDGEAVVKEAYLKYLSENALDPTSFPSLVRLEREVVRAIAGLLRGDENVVGNFTSGGTESIMLAVKSARDKARAERGVTEPELVLPLTAHSAFHKSCQYLGVKPVVADFDPETFRADPASMRAAITNNTVLLAASAPSYAQGVVDPIREIGETALERGLLFHVDACMGGIMLPFLRELGYPVPDFDFTVPGVTSISADMHKFGYAAKGASTILYKNKDIRKHQIFSKTGTTTYALVNPTILSSKSGGPMAGAWAILHYLGRDGYRGIFKAVKEATDKMVAGINAIPGLRVLGRPDMCIFCFTADGLNVYQLADAMAKRGWYLQPQFSTEKSPHNVHITLNYSNVPVVDDFLADLAECAAQVRASKNAIDIDTVRAQVKMMLDSFGDKAIEQLTAMAGIDGDELPADMALVNSILNALPGGVSAELLREYINDLFV